MASRQADRATAVEPVPVSPLRDGIPDAALGIAIIQAVLAHDGQVDKAGKPYVLHPLRVMLRLDEPKRQIAAVLHDVVEDCGISLDRIEAIGGREVRDAVDALTRRKGESYADFIERCGQNDIARGVKCADLRDNMDLSRLPVVTAADRARNDKYRRSHDRLIEMAIAAQGNAPCA